ncbi:MAG: hypothetical protein RL481_1192, partial [Pseudomonadota bacterium]
IFNVAMVQRDFGYNGYTVMHRLAVYDDAVVTQLAEQAFGKQAINDLRFLQAKNIGSLFAKETFDNVDARANRVDVPGCDTKGSCHAALLKGEGAMGQGRNRHPE